MKYRVRPAIEWLKSMSYLSDSTAEPTDIIDCSLGVNPYGVSPEISKDIYASSFNTLNCYPPYPYTNTCKAVAQYWSDTTALKPEQISMQSGSMSALCTINNMFLDAGSHILVSLPCFSSYVTHARSCGALIDHVPLCEEHGFKFNAEKFIQAIKPEHRLIYIDNPNNPTGQHIPLADIKKVLDAALKMEVMVLVDEAYGDFESRHDSAVTLINSYENLLVVKTFSKGFGLGAVRAGYIVMPEAAINVINRCAGEMNITTIACELIPHALSDQQFVDESITKIRKSKQKIIDSLSVIKVSETSLNVPIALYYVSEDLDLAAALETEHIKIEKGVDFEGIGKRHVRLRVPADNKVDELIARLQKVEQQIKQQ